MHLGNEGISIGVQHGAFITERTLHILIAETINGGICNLQADNRRSDYLHIFQNLFL